IEFWLSTTGQPAVVVSFLLLMAHSPGSDSAVFGKDDAFFSFDRKAQSRIRHLICQIDYSHIANCLWLWLAKNS
ncbi:MAG: hypothetical protein WBO88_02435, partial [Candidatus Dechloromonas phosphoritropha]